MHIYNLREYHQDEITVLRIIVATEGIAEGEKNKLSGQHLTANLVEALTKVLSTYWNVLSAKPGEMKGAVHNISIKDTPPIRSMPFRMCPAWREQITNEVQLLEGDIIEKCNDSWSFLIIPVKKQQIDPYGLWKVKPHHSGLGLLYASDRRCPSPRIVNICPR